MRIKTKGTNGKKCYPAVETQAGGTQKNVDKALLNDSEIITIALCGEIVDVDSENAWYSFVKKNYRNLFHRMRDRSQFNRTLRNLLQITNLIFTQLAGQFTDDFFIVDSFPLEMCKFGRVHFCKVFRSDGAAYSRNPLAD